MFSKIKDFYKSLSEIEVIWYIAVIGIILSSSGMEFLAFLLFIITHIIVHIRFLETQGTFKTTWISSKVSIWYYIILELALLLLAFVNVK